MKGSCRDCLGLSLIQSAGVNHLSSEPLDTAYSSNTHHCLLQLFIAPSSPRECLIIAALMPLTRLGVQSIFSKWVDRWDNRDPGR